MITSLMFVVRVFLLIDHNFELDLIASVAIDGTLEVTGNVGNPLVLKQTTSLITIVEVILLSRLMSW